MLRITLKSHSTICIFTRSHKKMWVSYVNGTPKMSQIGSLIYWITSIWRDRQANKLKELRCMEGQTRRTTLKHKPQGTWGVWKDIQANNLKTHEPQGHLSCMKGQADRQTTLKHMSLQGPEVYGKTYRLTTLKHLSLTGTWGVWKDIKTGKQP